MLGTSIDSMIILQEPIRLILALPVLCGIYLISKLVNMVIYELQYYNGAGEDYLDYGKDVMERIYWERKILNVPVEVKGTSSYIIRYWNYL